MSPKTTRKPKVSMMDQFWAAKKEQPDALLFFRMGDFYELFGDDAKVAAKELGIALTSRAKGTPDALPMAGVPVKAMDGYLLKLVKLGHKVAICEQMSDPRTTKGIVDRAIVRVVTAGTLTEEDALDARASNWLASLAVDGKTAGLAWVDLSTGRFQVTELELDGLDDQLARLDPAELLMPDGLELESLRHQLGNRLSPRDDWRFEREACRRVLHDHFKVATLEGYGVEDDSIIIPAAGALLEYLQETQRGTCEHVLTLQREDTGQHLVLDRATRSTLELVQTQRGGRREGSLLEVIDRTQTPMGGRLLREWLLAPLREVDPIRYRQKGVAELVDGPFLREEIRTQLGTVLDIERLVAKVSTGRANGRDLLALANSLAVVRPLYDQLENVYSSLLGDLRESLDPLDELVGKVTGSLVDSPPTTLKEGGLIREGVNADLDELRQIAGDGKAWMARFQADEAERTGLPGLKVGYNSVFGYYIEIPRAQAANAPEEYIRKQTLKNAERFITPELKEFEEKVLSAEDRSTDMEYDLFNALRDEVAGEVPRILATAAALATLDVIASMAQLAGEQRYVAPTIDGGERIHVIDGRHPVIEVTQTDDAFVPNDTVLDRKDKLLGLITGPNMAGKSTYIRQTALIVLMAQIGSFVPASEASIGVVDRIFTRIGSADDLSRGASTFMVEMVEIAGILNNATSRSLVVLDEVGRGTSTFDGLALAWAIVEHLHEQIRARTLFATHYHQLTELSERFKGVHNLNVAVREWQDEIVFLHKIVEGGTDRSYGIQVARLAGVPQELVTRAKSILIDLEKDGDLAPRVAPPPSTIPLPNGAEIQLGLFEERADTEVEKALREIDVDQTTPLEALIKLKELKDKL